MVKKNNNRFGDTTSPEKKNNGPKKDPKIVSINTLIEKYNQELVSAIGPKSILQFTKITTDVLKDELENDCSINWREVDGNYRLYLTKKWVEQKSQGEIHVIVRPDGTFSVRLNPYNTYQKKYFLAEKMDTKELVRQIPTIKSFLFEEKAPEQGVFKIETYQKAA